MRTYLWALLAFAMALTGCVAQPTTRSEFMSVPLLDSDWTRVYVTAGTGSKSGIKLWSVHQVGPVYVGDQRLGDTAKNEYIVVDLIPGTYEMSCSPLEPEKNFVEKRNFVFNAGETHFLACDMETSGGVAFFGLAGVLAADYISKTYLAEKPQRDPEGRVVAYKKLATTVPAAFQGAAPPTAPISIQPSVSNSTNSTADNVKDSLVQLKTIYEQGLITKEEYDRKRKQILDRLN